MEPREPRRIPDAGGSGPIRLGLSKWESAEIAASRWQPPPAHATTSPGRRAGLWIRALFWVAVLLGYWPASFFLSRWLQRLFDRFEPWSTMVVAVLVVGFLVVCFIGFELSRRHRIRILPGSDRD